MIQSDSGVYYLGYLAVFYTCFVFSLSGSSYLTQGLMNSTLKGRFLDLFCNDPGIFSLHINDYGNFTMLSPSYLEDPSNPLFPKAGSTIQCDFTHPERNDSFAIFCRVINSTNETFSEGSECSLQQLDSSCINKCVYVWTPRLNDTYLVLDVGPCDRGEDRFTSKCPVLDDNSVPLDDDDDTSGDPMKVLALCIIFLQTSIISVFFGFMMFIDII